jgi:hypothetical protein
MAIDVIFRRLEATSVRVLGRGGRNRESLVAGVERARFTTASGEWH